MSELPKLAAPAMRALASINIQSLEDLSQYKEDEISKLHGMGPNALSKIKAAMATLGLKFLTNESLNT